MITKKPVKKRVINNVEPEIPTKYISMYSKSITVNAVLRSSLYASYEFNSDNNSSFHKLLIDKMTAHKALLGDLSELTYIECFTNAGFKFKPVSSTVYFDKSGSYCMPDAIVDKKCVFTLRVLPYDFHSDDGRRICGLVIKVLRVQSM